MCGILAILGLQEDAHRFRDTALQLAKRIRHRGPDWSGIYMDDHCILAHERLAIVDVVSGAQPILSADGSVALAVNGEIYNHEFLREGLETRFKFRSRSDCEVILHMFEEDRSGQFLSSLEGMFAFVVYDSKTKSFMAARDPLGIIPLYYGFGKDGSVWFSSELKAIADHCAILHQFPPGCFYDSSRPGKNKITPYYSPAWMESVPSTPVDLSRLREALTKSVRSHLMSEVPFGVLLSGGLDSSLIASIASKIMKEQSPSSAKLRSFSIGLEGSPDLEAANKVANFLNSQHHSLTFTLQEGLDALSDVIYHIETYDVTTVRASTPMFLMARMIKAFGIKMVLSGEGADEIFGGYLYFHKAPNREEFHAETVRKLKALHMYDCLRANKAMSAWGVEARVPFLDTKFIEASMNLDPLAKMTVDPIKSVKRIEKFILRAAFDPALNPDKVAYEYLPKEILWRQKEQFSDGVGYAWIDSLKSFAESQISDSMMETAEYRFPHNTPLTKEGYLYRQFFESHFPSHSAMQTVPGGPSIACSSSAAIAWDASFGGQADPSGRAVRDVHLSAERG
jgi:asparagine synthase (glutamine-hydrolysing)